MKLQRNVLSKADLQEIEKLVNKLDVAVIGARLSSFERGRQRAEKGDYALNEKLCKAAKYILCQRDEEGDFILIDKFW